jgi:hypothetical protein
VNQTGDIPFVFRLDGDTVAAVAHGNYAVLQIISGTDDDGVQLCVNTVVRILDRAAHLAKSRACVITDLFLRNNAAPDLVVQICQRLQGSEVAFQGIGLLPIPSPFSVMSWITTSASWFFSMFFPILFLSWLFPFGTGFIS